MSGDIHTPRTSPPRSGKRGHLVSQASLAVGGIYGIADMLRRAGAGRNEVWDVKVSRWPRRRDVAQFALYADVARRMGLALSGTARLVLGDARFVLVDFDLFGASSRRL